MMEHFSPLVLPHPLSQPPTLSTHLTPSTLYPPSPDAFSMQPTPPASTFERMRHVQSLASYDVSLGLRYVPPTSPALSALALSASTSAIQSHSLSSYSHYSPPVTSQQPPPPQPQPHYSLFSSYPGVAVVSNTPTVDTMTAAGEERERRKAREAERKKKQADTTQAAEEKKRAEEERRRRQEASRRRRMEQLRKAREEREWAAEEEWREGEAEERQREYPTLAEVMPPKPQPPVGRGGGGGERTGRREWVDVSEAELAQQRRHQDEQLKEERRLKQMQEKIALLKARMGVREQRTVVSSPASASHPRLSLTFSASPYAPLSASRRPPASPSRHRSSPHKFLSPRRRPHPFLRHSPARRRRLSPAPNKHRTAADQYTQPTLQQRQQQKQQHEQRHDPRTPNKAKRADSPTRRPNQSAAQSDSQQHSRRGSDVPPPPAPNISTAYLHSLVEAEIAKHISGLAIASTHRPTPPPSPPLIPHQSTASPLPLLHRYAAVSVIDSMDELVAAVLDRLVGDTVTELNAAEERQRASVVLDEVDEMVSELERLEDSVTQRWLPGTPPNKTQRRDGMERRYAHDDVAATSSPDALLPHQLPADVDHSLASGAVSQPASRSAPFHPRVLPVCSDVSPQLADPTGVALAERWCDELVDEAVDSVVAELWQCLDTMVDGMVQQEVN